MNVFIRWNYSFWNPLVKLKYSNAAATNRAHFQYLMQPNCWRSINVHVLSMIHKIKEKNKRYRKKGEVPIKGISLEVKKNGAKSSLKISINDLVSYLSLLSPPGGSSPPPLYLQHRTCCTSAGRSVQVIITNRKPELDPPSRNQYRTLFCCTLRRIVYLFFALRCCQLQWLCGVKVVRRALNKKREREKKVEVGNGSRPHHVSLRASTLTLAARI